MVVKHGEADIAETICLVIFPLVSLMKDQVSSVCEKGVKANVLGPESSDTETKDASEGKYNLVFTSPEVPFSSHLALKNKIQAVFIDEVHCVVKWLVVFSYPPYNVNKLWQFHYFLSLDFSEAHSCCLSFV